MTDETRLGKYETKLTTIPPPREYPRMEKDEGPAQTIGEEASTIRMIVVKKAED